MTLNSIEGVKRIIKELADTAERTTTELHELRRENYELRAMIADYQKMVDEYKAMADEYLALLSKVGGV